MSIQPMWKSLLTFREIELATVHKENCWGLVAVGWLKPDPMRLDRVTWVTPASNHSCENLDRRSLPEGDGG